MASFTDSIQQFNPYVQQLPIDAMLYVGQQKQQAYDQGVQKIQAQIDQVAGMDVVRDVDKQYLQATLNQLGGNLKKVAAGDFSNFQLQNSVGGMIKQIGRDPNIQNAVGSTARYRKNVEAMETARKEGKSSPSNEYVFNRTASEWLNNKDVKASFNGEYKPYSNWKKNGLELLKSLTKDETITDDAFTTDSRGNLVIADATVRKKLAGISPEKIQQALMVGLTPGDFDQMGIDGIYNYANADGKTFYNHVNSAREATLKHYTDQRTTLQNAKSSTTSVPEKSKLDSQIADLDKTIRGINSEYNDITGAISQGNLDGAKAQYFTRNAIDGFAKAFSFTETSQTLENSPLAAAQRWREDKAQDWAKFVAKFGQDERFHNENKGLKLAELAQKDKENSGYGGLPQPVSQEELPKYTLSKVVSEIQDKELSIKNADETFIAQNGKDKKWLAEQKLAWEKSPSGVDALIANHFNSTEQARRSVDADKIMVSDIEKQATAKFGDINDLIPKDVEPLIYTNGNVQYSYSPKDFVDFNTKFKKYITQGSGSFVSSSGMGGGKGTVYDYETAKQELSPKEYHLFQLMGAKTPPKGEGDKVLLNEIRHYSNTVNQPYSETLNKIMDFTADEVSKRVTQNQGVGYNIPTAKPEQKTSIATTLTQFADLAEKPGGLANSPNFDVDKARKLALDPNARYSIAIVEGTERQPAMYKMTVTGKDGTINFNVTPEQKRAVFGSDYEASPAVQMIRPYQEQIRKMGGYSTALSPGQSNHENAYLSPIDFPSVKTYGIKANIVKPTQGNEYSVRLSIYDPVTQVWHEDIGFPRNRTIGEESIASVLMGLNDAALFELINETPATANDLKQVEKASKKPL